jgi:regulator of protease activity HflC (stomatin/prohibitin superfamily)
MKDNANLMIEEKAYHAQNGWKALIASLIVYIAAIVGVVCGGMMMDEGMIVGIPLFVVSLIYIGIGWIFWLGLKVIRPNEALVLTLFGKYMGTLREEGFFYVNPFCVGVAPSRPGQSVLTATPNGVALNGISKKISMKAITLDNPKQKINDAMGNPIDIGIIVIWRVVNAAQAVFAVDDYMQYVSTQADSALRDVARLYPYDAPEGAMSLRSSSQEVADQLETELQARVEMAGLQIIEARITHLAYAPEIAAAMLQRQQATAIIEARQKIVDGAVGMVEMALEKLSENQVCQLDEERKAQMVSNLLVVLCGNRDAQPVVNTSNL